MALCVSGAERVGVLGQPAGKVLVTRLAERGCPHDLRASTMVGGRRNPLNRRGRACRNGARSGGPAGAGVPAGRSDNEFVA